MSAAKRAPAIHAAASQRERAFGLLPELADRVVPTRRIRHRLISVLAGVLTLAMLATLFAGVWGYRWWETQLGARESIPAAPLSNADTAAFVSSAEEALAAPAGTGAEPVVITYHDISPDRPDNKYIVSPTQFAAQMKMLSEAGYRSLTADDFLRYQQGGSVPPRSVLITFDDGTRGLWTYADKVLKRYGFTAVSFLITGRVGTRAPYYLTWPLVNRMHNSGRWDFQSHTYDMHTKVEGPTGERVSAVSSRLVTNGRREDLDELRARVAADLEQSLRDFAAHELPRPQLFAWPFSDVTGDPNDPAGAATAAAEIGQVFELAFVNAYQPNPATRSALRNGTVERLEVFGPDTARSLFDRLQAMSTLPVQDLRPTQRDQNWLEDGGHPVPLDIPKLAKGVVKPDARTLTYLTAYWAPQRTGEWTDYRVTGTVVPPKGGGAPGILLRGEGADQVAVRVSANVATVTVGGKPFDSRTFSDSKDANADRHQVDIAVSASKTRVVVDDKLLATVPVKSKSGALGGIGVAFSREFPGDAWGSVRGLRVRPLE